MIMSSQQTAFYQEFLMKRGSFKPQDFGVDMEKEEFLDLMVNEFNAYARTSMTIDELLLNPSQALHFVSVVRAKHRYFSVPEDIILRSIMMRRKNPV